MTILKELKLDALRHTRGEITDDDLRRSCAKAVAEATGLDTHWCKVGSEGISNSLPVLKFGLYKLANLLEDE